MVVKHWFRNTLFKERQRNKDSPYNFNNPPSTTLNIEEYERTVQEKSDTTIEGIYCQNKAVYCSSSLQAVSNDNEFPSPHQILKEVEQIHPDNNIPGDESSADLNKEECFNSIPDTNSRKKCIESQECDITLLMRNASPPHNDAISASSLSEYLSCDKSESNSSGHYSRPQTPNNILAANASQAIDYDGQRLERHSLGQMGPPKKHQSTSSNTNCNMTDRPSVMNVVAVGILPNNKLSQFDTNSNSANTAGKRANRTRFTDYQIKVLQEFFENNSYPKDSDLEYLSKLLLLSPRVIVVWFQNARQKQRKIYENQPNSAQNESEDKKHNINYACKRCSLVFQRYYELIRHQKNHCFKEENNKRSAKAQKAAAQIAQNLSSEDSNSSMDINNSANSSLVSHTTSVVTTPATTPASIKNSRKNYHQETIKSDALEPPGIENDECNEVHGNCKRNNVMIFGTELLREHQVRDMVKQSFNNKEDFTTLHKNHVHTVLKNLQQQNETNVVINDETNRLHLCKRKYSETLSKNDEHFPIEAFSLNFENQTKNNNFLYQYFVQDEGSDAKFSVANEDKVLSGSLSRENTSNKDYEFLIQYYKRNEQNRNDSFELVENNKPNFESLWQYYQLMESYKYFQLDCSSKMMESNAHATSRSSDTTRQANASCNFLETNDNEEHTKRPTNNAECDILRVVEKLTSERPLKIVKAPSYNTSIFFNGKKDYFSGNEKNYLIQCEENMTSNICQNATELIEQLDGLHEIDSLCIRNPVLNGLNPYPNIRCDKSNSQRLVLYPLALFSRPSMLIKHAVL